MQQQHSIQRKESNDGLGAKIKAAAGSFGWIVDGIQEIIYKFSNLPETNFRLGCEMIGNGRIDDAILRFKMCLWLAPNYLDALYSLGCLYHHKGDDQAAMDAFVKVLRQDPVNENTLYMVSTINPALLKPEMQPKTMPFGMALEYFEGIAMAYDQTQQTDGYQIPALLHQFLHQAFDGKRFNDLVDLGCGTGLCGAQFREEFTNTIGVDMANNMLDVAYRRVDRRGVMIYNRLVNQDLHYYLDEADSNITDVALCMSVFPYLGDLEAIFAGIKKVLRPGGFFACTFDPLNRPGDYGVMTSTGYFGHSIDYVLRLAKANGLETIRTGGVRAYPERMVDLCIFRKVENTDDSVNTTPATTPQPPQPQQVDAVPTEPAPKMPSSPMFGNLPVDESETQDDSASLYSDDPSDDTPR